MKDKPKHPGGRPSNYSKEMAVRICKLIATGNKGLNSLCKEHSDLPDYSTIFDWIAGNQEFTNLYEKAKQEQAEFLADEILEIADDKTSDTIIRDGMEVVDKENIQRSRLRVDARKWIAAKLSEKIR